MLSRCRDWITNLIDHVLLLYRGIRTNILIQGPRKLTVQLFCDEAHGNAAETANDGADDQTRRNMLPESPVILGKRIVVHVVVYKSPGLRILHLSMLQYGGDGETNVSDAEHENLNVVFDAVCVECQDHLVDASKAVDG
jgi:hypothetical protein